MSLIALSTAWPVGWTIGVVVVVLVVVLLLLLIQGASKAATKAQSIVEALDQARDNTAGLWNIDTTNRTIVSITGSAKAAREYLESTVGRP